MYKAALKALPVSEAKRKNAGAARHGGVWKSQKKIKTLSGGNGAADGNCPSYAQ